MNGTLTVESGPIGGDAQIAAKVAEGLIEAVRGCHVFPDAVTTGQGEDPQWLYTVAIQGRELWAMDLAALATSCVPGPDRLCLAGGRFGVTVRWRDQHNGGRVGVGTAVPDSHDAAGQLRGEDAGRHCRPL